MRRKNNESRSSSSSDSSRSSSSRSEVKKKIVKKDKAVEKNNTDRVNTITAIPILNTLDYVYVENLTSNIKEAHLNEIFSNFGKIKKIYKYQPFKNFRNYKMTALIQFNDFKDVEETLKYMQNGQLDGQILKLIHYKLTEKEAEKYMKTNKLDLILKERELEKAKKPLSPIKNNNNTINKHKQAQVKDKRIMKRSRSRSIKKPTNRRKESSSSSSSSYSSSSSSNSSSSSSS
jgi:hypothetical protein